MGNIQYLPIAQNISPCYASTFWYFSLRSFKWFYLLQTTAPAIGAGVNALTTLVTASCPIIDATATMAADAVYLPSLSPGLSTPCFINKNVVLAGIIISFRSIWSLVLYYKTLEFVRYRELSPRNYKLWLLMTIQRNKCNEGIN